MLELNTSSIFFLDASIAGSAAQCITKSNFFNFFILLNLEISILMFEILFSVILFLFKIEPFLDKLSILVICTVLIFSFKKIARLEPINPQPPVISILIYCYPVSKIFFFRVIGFCSLFNISIGQTCLKFATSSEKFCKICLDISD